MIQSLNDSISQSLNSPNRNPQSPVPNPQPPTPNPQFISSIQENIRKAEYNITRQDNCVIEGEPGGLHAANRANNLRAYFREDGVQIVERESSDPDWHVRYTFTAWGRETGTVPSERVPERDGTVPVSAVTPTHEGNRVEYRHAGITEWYENTEAGLEHGFTIAQRPSGDGDLLIEGVLGGDVRPHASAANTVLFSDTEGRDVLQYTKLLVADANGEQLSARMRLANNPQSAIRNPQSNCSLQVVVDDDGAAYPITVDPIYVSVIGDAQLYGNQENAEFGGSVSGAGDVNGDGYGDVIVGAYYYDNGEEDEGAAFVFLGSASGLVGADPSSAATVLEGNQGEAYFGYSVSGAGDVNGDGYADVIVGAYRYDNSENNEGAAFVFLGSASGLVGTDPSSAASMLEGNQLDAHFGGSVSGAGDVNGDGYADVIVGASGYDNGQQDEGAAFVFLGSAAGLVGTGPSDAASMLESNQAGHALYGDPVFGGSVSSAGDVNGDGYADVIVGASGYDNGEPYEGAAFVFLGSATGVVGTDPSSAHALLESNQAAHWTGFGYFPKPYFGISVSGAGDVNGDGYADIIVGASMYVNHAWGDFEGGGVPFPWLGVGGDGHGPIHGRLGA